jgi:hypothetical protein
METHSTTGGTVIKELTVIFLYIGLVIASLTGWIWNIVKLYGLGPDPLTEELVIRVVGIFVAPLGVVMGYL